LILSPDEIALVKSSFEKVKPISEHAAALFYARLFEIAPETQRLFKNDMQHQGRKLMSTLGLVVSSLDRLDVVLPNIRKLAMQHVAWGVLSEQFEPVGEALLWMLHQVLGEEFTPIVRDAWVTAYRALSAIMIAEAYPETSPGDGV
jgi:hemoglobin-like flavoprotein